MNNTEFYDRLGVSKNASQDEIKRAYRKLSKKYHPDINKEAGAEDKYKEVQEAYETLSDEQKRAAYDQYGAAGANGGFGGGAGGFGGFDGSGFGGFEDIFSSFFGGGGTRNPNAPRQGDDLQYRVNLRFEEAIFGAEKEIKYNREATCRTCDGSGAKPGTSPVTCGRCHGSGVINVDTQTPLGMMRRQVTCDVCHGRGKEIKSPCETRNRLTASRSKSLLVWKLVSRSVCLVKARPALMAALMVIFMSWSKLSRATSLSAMALPFTTSSISTLSKRLLVTAWIFQLFTGMLS